MKSQTSAWTNLDCSRTKAAISDLKYIHDPFIAHLVTSPALRRTPEIHRGYWARSVAVTHLVRQFCAREGPQRAQVVNIGSGSDSLYFRLKSESVGFARVVDVDTPETIAEKVHAISKSALLSAHIETDREETERDRHALHSRRYHLIGCDATKARRLTQLLTAECHVSAELPVLFVFECVLLYWTAEETQTLITGLSRAFSSAAFVVLDVVNTDDNFARVMQQSLSERATPLLGVASSQTLDDWRKKFTENGVKNVSAWDMNEVYERLLAREDVQRIERLEFLDERELLSQLLRHYCLVFATNYLNFLNLW